MTLSNILSTNIPNFHNLALFICHLFIDGQFRTGHILYDPNAFPVTQFITEIQSICPHSIPWISTDVTEPSRLPWNVDDRTDQILQLIFFDPNNLPKNINEIDKILTFYRLFIHSTNDDLKIKSQISTIIEKNSASKTNLAPNRVALNTLKIGQLHLHWIWKDDFEDSKILDEQSFRAFSTRNPKKENLFEITFGKYEQNWLMTINHAISTPCKQSRKLERVSEIRDGYPFFANFFMTKLNASYINLTVESCKNSKLTSVNRFVKQKSRRFYKELTTEYETVKKPEIVNSKANQPKVIHFDLPSLVSEDGEKSQTALYPYRSTKLIVLFVYGTDFKRQKQHILLSDNLIFYHYLCVVGFILSAMVLCFLRRRNRLRRDGLFSSVIDINIAYFGGGTLRSHHQLERFFLGIFLISGFFWTAVCFDAVLYPYFLVQDEKVKTFADLIKINPPIFSGFRLKENAHVVFDRLSDVIGPGLRYEGTRSFLTLLQDHEKSFAFVTKEYSIDRIRTASKHVRDLDLLEDNLGTMNYPYHLTSNQYIPKRMVDKIDEATSSMMENGIYGFYKSIGTFLEELRGYNEFDEEITKFKPFTLQQSMGLIVLFAVMFVLTFIIFIVEIIVHKFQKWQHQRIRQRQIQRANERRL